jgi:hypothetical protein
MLHDNNSSAPASARTSNKPAKTPLTESQYLRKQQADARRAIEHTLSELKLDLIKTADPRAWMQMHPWATLGASAIAGFVTTAAFVPSKEQQALDRLAKIQETLARHEHPERFDGNGNEGGKSRIGGLIYRVIQPMFISTVTGFVTGKAAAAPQAGPSPESEPFTTAAAPTGVDSGI